MYLSIGFRVPGNLTSSSTVEAELITCDITANCCLTSSRRFSLSSASSNPKRASQFVSQCHKTQQVNTDFLELLSHQNSQKPLSTKHEGITKTTI